MVFFIDGNKADTIYNSNQIGDAKISLQIISMEDSLVFRKRQLIRRV